MGRRLVLWFVGSAGVLLVGLAIASRPQLGQVGAVFAVVGVLALTGFLLYVWRIATTRDDQWIWQTPGKPRREYRAEQAAERDPRASGDET